MLAAGSHQHAVIERKRAVDISFLKKIVRDRSERKNLENNK
jgi:hypothetical protein